MFSVLENPFSWKTAIVVLFTSHAFCLKTDSIWLSQFRFKLLLHIDIINIVPLISFLWLPSFSYCLTTGLWVMVRLGKNGKHWTEEYISL